MLQHSVWMSFARLCLYKYNNINKINVFDQAGTGIALTMINSKNNIEQRRIPPCLNSKKLSTD